MQQSAVRSDPAGHVARLIENMERVIVGKRGRIERLVVGLRAGGHVLIEDIPGVGKTTLARALARSIDAGFRRLQFTPDLLPAVITGVSIFDQSRGEFVFQPGPIFTHIVLADEINRTTPRTQSALLEAMNEAEVSADGVTHALPEPFFVIATQNPLEYTGTYPLPESQLDRFLLRIGLDYPTLEEEKRILESRRSADPLDSLEPVLRTEDVLVLREGVRDIRVEEPIVDYITRIAAATREHEQLAAGASPRASLGLYRAAQAYARVRGRDHVLPDDVKRAVAPVLRHRVAVSPELEMSGQTADQVLAALVEDVEAPRQ